MTGTAQQKGPPRQFVRHSPGVTLPVLTILEGSAPDSTLTMCRRNTSPVVSGAMMHSAPAAAAAPGVSQGVWDVEGRCVLETGTWYK